MGTIVIGIIVVVLVLAVAASVYVRTAPSDPAEWNNPQLSDMAPGEYPGERSFIVERALDGAAAGEGAQTFARLDTIIRATPRTTVLAGSPQDGRITYITRSQVFGFPDYTTVTLSPSPATLQIYGRARFGKLDMGVNAARIKGWLAELDGDTPTR